VEANPALGIHNNVRGSLTVARSAIACQVSNMVLISTDKAVRPTNIMGASKRIAELVVQSLADLGDHGTCFTCVRFGNVLDSSGSVVPRFRKQLAEGHALTVTHPDVTRYFMSIPEAVRLVIQAGAMACGGEVFLLDMGKPIRIYDLALQMIRLSGLELGKDMDIQITGLRPGEKLYEELLIDKTKATATHHPRIFCAQEYRWPWNDLEPQLERLLMATQTYNLSDLMVILKKLVPEYQPPCLSEEIMQSQKNPN
jgi:FlaA1/EpsC-like NDP-sugar epimerase